MAECLPQGAPSRQKPHVVPIAQRHRPHRASAGLPLHIGVAETECLLLPQSLPHLRQNVFFVVSERRRAVNRIHRMGFCLLRQARGQHCVHFTQHRACRLRHFAIGMRRPAHTQHQCLQLVFAKHQRRQIAVLLQHKTHTRFPANHRSLPAQCVDVAIHRAHADAQLLRQQPRTFRMAAGTQKLQEFE